MGNSQTVGMNRRKYRVALSFPGECRKFVEQVARHLAHEFGRAAVFYDQFHRAKTSVINLDLLLQDIYEEQSDLVVFFLCAEYATKDWCGIEWRSIRALMSRKDRSERSVMPVLLEDAHLDGFLEIDGCLDARDLSAKQVSAIILERLGHAKANHANMPRAWGGRRLASLLFPLFILLTGALAGYVAWTWDDVSLGDLREIPSIEEELPAVEPMLAGSGIAGNDRRLVGHVDELLARLHSGRPSFGVTPIEAPAGVGKSRRVSWLQGKLGGNVHVVRLDELKRDEDLVRSLGVSLEDDLITVDGDNPFNTRLPAFRDHEAPAISTLINAFGDGPHDGTRSFIVVDSLDEIHPDSALSLLERLYGHVASVREDDPEGFLHVLVFGRPESFAPFFRDSNYKDHSLREHSVTLTVPRLDGEEDYRRVIEQTWEYLNVQEKTRTALRLGETLSVLVGLVNESDVVRESLHIPAFRSKIVLNPRDCESDDQMQVEELLFGEMLARSSKSHSRPGDDNETYRRLLEDVAAKYAGSLTFDSRSERPTGYFTVPYGEETTVVASDGTSLTFS